MIIQAFLLAALIFLPNPGSELPFIGIIGRTLELIGVTMLIFAIINLRHSLTVLPTPTKSGKLQIYGMYRYIRHPMYSAVIILSFGLAITSGWYLKYLLTLTLVILLNYKARYEEYFLNAKYPNYSEYMSSTGRFMPKF